MSRRRLDAWQDPPPAPNETWQVGDVARCLDVSRRRVHDLVEQGRLAPYQRTQRGALLFFSNEVLRFAHQQILARMNGEIRAPRPLQGQLNLPLWGAEPGTRPARRVIAWPKRAVAIGPGKAKSGVHSREPKVAGVRSKTARGA